MSHTSPNDNDDNNNDDDNDDNNDEPWARISNRNKNLINANLTMIMLMV